MSQDWYEQVQSLLRTYDINYVPEPTPVGKVGVWGSRRGKKIHWVPTHVKNPVHKWVDEQTAVPDSPLWCHECQQTYEGHLNEGEAWAAAWGQVLEVCQKLNRAPLKTGSAVEFLTRYQPQVMNLGRQIEVVDAVAGSINLLARCAEFPTEGGGTLHVGDKPAQLALDAVRSEYVRIMGHELFTQAVLSHAAGIPVQSDTALVLCWGSQVPFLKGAPVGKYLKVVPVLQKQPDWVAVRTPLTTQKQLTVAELPQVVAVAQVFDLLPVEHSGEITAGELTAKWAAARAVLNY